MARVDLFTDQNLSSAHASEGSTLRKEGIQCGFIRVVPVALKQNFSIPTQPKGLQRRENVFVLDPFVFFDRLATTVGGRRPFPDLSSVLLLLLHILVLNVLPSDFLAHKDAENEDKVQSECSEAFPEGNVSRRGHTEYDEEPEVSETGEYGGNYESSEPLDSLDFNSS